MSDSVNHPPHYKAANGLEAIDVIEAFGLDQSFALGNAAKYLLRAGRKGETLQDLKKARWYLNRKIEQLEGSNIVEHSFAPLYYLATPYTKYQGGNIDAAFLAACKLTADLITAGHNIYSPIVHCHPVTVNSGLDPLDHTLWLAVDAAMMDAADALLVAQMEGWRESYGVDHEIKFFTAQNKRIRYLDIETMTISKVPASAPENGKTGPDLEALLERARNHVMTPAEIAAQRRSWVIGELMLAHPEMSRPQAESIVDSVIQGSVPQSSSSSPDPNQNQPAISNAEGRRV